jgi:hypothetical protein
VDRQKKKALFESNMIRIRGHSRIR